LDAPVHWLDQPPADELDHAMESQEVRRLADGPLVAPWDVHAYALSPTQILMTWQASDVATSFSVTYDDGYRNPDYPIWYPADPSDAGKLKR